DPGRADGQRGASQRMGEIAAQFGVARPRPGQLRHDSGRLAVKKLEKFDFKRLVAHRLARQMHQVDRRLTGLRAPILIEAGLRRGIVSDISRHWSDGDHGPAFPAVGRPKTSFSSALRKGSLYGTRPEFNGRRLQ